VLPGEVAERTKVFTGKNRGSLAAGLRNGRKEKPCCSMRAQRSYAAKWIKYKVD
jgi:hypothetical protein